MNQGMVRLLLAGLIFVGAFASAAPSVAVAASCSGTDAYVFNSTLGSAGTASVNRGITVPSNGATIHASLYVPPGISAVAPAPAVLETHGGGQNRAAVETDRHTRPLLNGLLARGYVVMT